MNEDFYFHDTLSPDAPCVAPRTVDWTSHDASLFAEWIVFEIRHCPFYTVCLLHRLTELRDRPTHTNSCDAPNVKRGI